MTAPESQAKSTQPTAEQLLNKRLEGIAWALFLIMIGGLGLVPKSQVPEGVWLIGVGLIMLGLNVARRLNAIKMSGGTIVLGILALLSGLGSLLGVAMPLFPILLILLGVHALYDLVFEKAKA